MSCMITDMRKRLNISQIPISVIFMYTQLCYISDIA
jgi:hypothetical protein